MGEFTARVSAIEAESSARPQAHAAQLTYQLYQFGSIMSSQVIASSFSRSKGAGLSVQMTGRVGFRLTLLDQPVDVLLEHPR